jgi:hypothetical protein
VGSEGVLGSVSSEGRLNFCRATALTLNNPEEYGASLPSIRSAAELMMVFIKMCLKAGITPGCYIGCADSVADQLSNNEITVKVAAQSWLNLKRRV